MTSTRSPSSQVVSGDGRYSDHRHSRPLTCGYVAGRPGDRGLKESDTAHLPGFPRTPHHPREPHNMRDNHTQDARQPRDLRISGHHAMRTYSSRYRPCTTREADDVDWDSVVV